MSQFVITPWIRLSAVAAIALAAAACGKLDQTAAAPSAAATPDAADANAVAVVNGMPISRTSYDIYLKSLLEGRPVPPDLTAEQKGQVLDQLINMQLLAAVGAKDGLDKDPDVTARLNLVRMRILADAESQKYLKTSEPTDAELHAQYDTVIASGEGTEYHARHILVKDKDKAEALIKKIKGGAKFEDIAKAESTDPSKTNGGDLGWFSLNKMVPPFAAAVKGLKKGEITQQPVQTQYGWHIIKLEDTRDPTFDQLKPQLQQMLIQKKLLAYIADQKAAAKIDKKPL